jgi:hypothetical protein
MRTKRLLKQIPKQQFDFKALERLLDLESGDTGSNTCLFVVVLWASG